MDSRTYLIPVKESLLIRSLTVAALFFLLMHGSLVLYNYLISEVPWYFLQLFDVNEENNLPTWFSGFNLLISTGLLWILMRDKRANQDAMAGRWRVLFFGFAFLSIDEIAGIHESINSVTDPSWAYGGGVVVLLLAVYFYSFLKSLPRPTLIAFIVAGAIFVGGAVGVEIIGEPMESDSLIYNLTTMVEEGMEIFGVIFFTRSLLRYMASSTFKMEVGMH